MSASEKLKALERAQNGEDTYEALLRSGSELLAALPQIVALVVAVESDPIKARSVKHALKELNDALAESLT